MKKLALLCVFLFSCSGNDDLEQISYSQFKQEVLANQIVEITYKSDQMTIIGNRFDGSKFKTTQPIYKKDEVLERALKENNVRQTYDPVEQPSISSQLFISALPLILIISIFFLSFAIWAAYLASNRNQSKALWFFLTLFFPFAIVVIAFKDKVEKN
tara:strand:+ start:117 stop:587 length:471 start_codon:yes stop_codon:yes gene_type:complete